MNSLGVLLVSYPRGFITAIPQSLPLQIWIDLDKFALNGEDSYDQDVVSFRPEVIKLLGGRTVRPTGPPA